ncbi:transcription factor 7-like 1-B isoform X2 [Hippocampus zosterae]|uniref:transcription factor 7-like 1-B isoform X2 n=1 Tax=Hippocampus zosterae TaxID=109293 RepID=UPI00223D75EF|nr:transcription factor 7-like 1-B isoform X2 [Hippocampus zosterae]
MPQLSDDGDLGANDELIPFKDEGENDDKTTTAAAAAAERDLDDVKSSLVNESETNNSPSDSESRVSGQAADRRARRQSDSAVQAGSSQLLGEALRRQTGVRGLFQHPAYMGYPFFMIPDLCGSYLTGGGLAAAGAHAYLPWQWPFLDVPGRAARRDSATPAHLSSGAPAHMAHLHPLLSYRPEAFSPPPRALASFSPDAGSSRLPHVARYPVSPADVAQMAHAFDWLSSPGLVSASPSPVPSPSSFLGVAIKQEPEEAREHSPLRKPVATAQDVSGSSDQKAKGHIKKPLNAFMLFMRDERPKVVAQCQVKESATINQILGQRWHSLSKDEQAKYYELARKERLLHSQLYPGWSARDNYGKKKKRKKFKGGSHQETATDDSPPPPKRTHLSPMHDEAPHAHALLTQTRAHTSSSSAHTRTHLSRPHTVSHLTHTHLSQASPASSVDSPATPTAALASPAAPAPTYTEHTHSHAYSTCGHGGRLSPGADQPLALTTKPPRSTLAPPTSTLDPSSSSSSSYR